MTLVQSIQDIFSSDKEIPPNESNTCDWIILPVLLAIGYDRRDIHSRIADGAGKFPDYTILQNDTTRQFYLEVKSWSVELQDDHAIQALNYANANGKRWVVLSNGQCWRLYDNRIQGPASEKLVTEVYNEDFDHFLRFLTAIGKDSVLANRIEDFAISEVEAKKSAAEQRILVEVQNERRRNLSRLFEQSSNDISCPLILNLVAHFREQPLFNETTPEDVIAMLRQWIPEAPMILSRDPAPAITPIAGGQELWYVNVGEGQHRSWDDNVKYGYLGAGQGPRWSQSLKKLQTGDRAYAYLKGCGFVGYGEILQPAVMIKDFRTITGAKLLDCPLTTAASDHMNDPDHAEWAVAIKWLKTFPRQQAKSYKGIFASTHVACRLANQPETLAFLAKEFG